MKQVSENEIDLFLYHNAVINRASLKNGTMLWDVSGITLKRDKDAVCDKKMTLYFCDFRIVSVVEYGTAKDGRSFVSDVEAEKAVEALTNSDYTVILHGSFEDDSSYCFDLEVYNKTFLSVVLKYGRFVAEWN